MKDDTLAEELSQGAVFKVINIDPDGSGMGWSGHMGSMVKQARRCCKNCTIIVGDVKGFPEAVGFTPKELESINDEARALLALVSR